MDRIDKAELLSPTIPQKREKTLPVNKSISLVPYHTGIDTFEVPDLVQWPQPKEEDYAVHIEACRN